MSIPGCANCRTTPAHWNFARSFFGDDDGSWVTRTYRFGDVVEALQSIAPFDWQAFFEDRPTDTHERAPLEGLERGGYRLVYRDTPNPFEASMAALTGTHDFTHSIGVMVAADGNLSDVLWEGPAFAARLTVGSRITAIGDRAYTPDGLGRAIAAATGGMPIRLAIATGKRMRSVEIAYAGGLRFPHLAAIDGARARIDEILTPLPS